MSSVAASNRHEDANSDAGTEAATTAAPPGLTSAEAQRRLAEFGPNALAGERVSRWRVFLAKFWAPIPWLLEAAAAVQIGLGAYVEACVIGALLLFNATLSMVQEGRAGAALSALKARLAPAALVCRDGNWAWRPALELVPGDAIRLPLGTIVPADARVLSGSILIDQSTLTGESLPVEAGPSGQVFAGSLVQRGQAVAEVTATGARTKFGHTADLVRVAHAASTEQAAVFGVTRNLAAFNGSVALLTIGYAFTLALPFPDLIRLALTALLASIPVALPATFTLSAAFGAQIMARRGVLLTRLSAAHEAAAMDVLCADKTGTLTQNALQVFQVRAMPGFERERVLALAVLASSEAEQDPIDAAIRAAAAGSGLGDLRQRIVRFVPFDPATKTAEALVLDQDGSELRIVKGAFQVIAEVVELPPGARQQVDELAAQGNRVIAIAAGRPSSLRLAGLVAISDPPREDSATFVARLSDLGVRTVMVTGDSPVTAAAIAQRVGISGGVCPPQRLADDPSREEFGVFARVLPEQKYRLVKALQSRGHVVGMCGDGVNDAPALRQAQIGIAVSSATAVAKAAAALVLTEPGLGGILIAVREGRVAFQRLLAYTFNMLVKKTEIVLFLAVGLALTGHAVMTPALMVLLFVTNDFLSMSLTTDRASPLPAPSAWRMRNITGAALTLGLCKLAFSTGVLALGRFRLGLGPLELQTLAFVTLVFGNQAALYVLREQRHLWKSRPGNWVVASSTADVSLAILLAVSGTLMQPLPWPVIGAILMAAALFALILDQIKMPVLWAFKLKSRVASKGWPS